MSDKDLLIAREIQDLATAIAESRHDKGLAETIKAVSAVTMSHQQMRENSTVQLQMPAPVIQLPPPQVDVTVNVPDQEPPVVNITVDVPDQPAPTVNVEAARPVAYKVEITRRDKDGFIAEFLMYPVEIV